MLTASQNKTYQFIKQYIAEHNIAPTEAEIALGIGIKSRGVVHRYIHAIADAGYIEVIPGRRRNIRLLEPSDDSTRGNDCSIPLVGRIAAGSPIDAIADNQQVNLNDFFLGPNRYALLVKGDSMIEDGIFDGDIVICEKADVANNGTIVVALVDNEAATLKRIQHNHDGTVTLIPANSQLSPMLYPVERVRIQGIFIGLVRR